MIRFFQNGLLLCGAAAVILLLISPIFNTTSKRPIPAPFFVDIEEEGPLIHGLVWLYEIVVTLLVATNILNLEGMIFFFIAIAAAELNILRVKIMEAITVHLLESENTHVRYRYDKIINGLLKECVVQHIAVERYVLSLQTTFNIAFLVQLTVSMVTTCFAAFTIIIIPITSWEFWFCVLFSTGAIFQLAFFCVSGNEVILQSEKIRDACYMSEWISCGPLVRKTLFIIMERTKRPMVLTAGNLIPLSLDTFVSVLRCAFSYFTVLRRMYLRKM